MSISSTLVKIEAQSGVAVGMKAGDLLRIVDPCGEQVADVALFDARAPSDGFSSGRTMDYNSRLKLRVGDTLYSNAGVALARVVEDTVGVHDMLLAPCSDAMFARRGQFGHPSCLRNLVGALRPFGIDAHAIASTLNVFMDVRIDEDGNIVISPPPSRAGDVFTLEALTDLSAGIAACSSEVTNNGRCKPMAYQLITAPAGCANTVTTLTTTERLREGYGT